MAWKSFLWVFLYFSVDKTVDNRLFEKRKGESMFAQGEESDTRFIIMFYQLRAECENTVFDVVCDGRQIASEK